MKVKLLFEPLGFTAATVKVTRAHKGSVHSFLQIMSKLYALPCVWTCRGLEIVIDLETGNLDLNMPASWADSEHDITTSIPMTDLCQLSTKDFHRKHIWPYAAEIAEKAFGMSKTANAIRRGARRGIIKKRMDKEYVHKVIDADLWNLLFLEKWDARSEYDPQPPRSTSTVWAKIDEMQAERKNTIS